MSLEDFQYNHFSLYTDRDQDSRGVPETLRNSPPYATIDVMSVKPSN